MKQIMLTQNQVTIVDDEDFDEISKYKWHAYYDKKLKSFYATRMIRIGHNKQRHERMHRKIMGLHYGDKREVDHKNHNTLDNRKDNLRVVTHRQNMENTKCISKYGVGVYYDDRQKTKKYQAKARVKGKQYCIGVYFTAEEASEARNKFLSNFVKE